MAPSSALSCFGRRAPFPQKRDKAEDGAMGYSTSKCACCQAGEKHQVGTLGGGGSDACGSKDVVTPAGRQGTGASLPNGGATEESKAHRRQSPDVFGSVQTTADAAPTSVSSTADTGTVLPNGQAAAADLLDPLGPQEALKAKAAADAEQARQWAMQEEENERLRKKQEEEEEERRARMAAEAAAAAEKDKDNILNSAAAIDGNIAMDSMALGKLRGIPGWTGSALNAEADDGSPSKAGAAPDFAGSQA